MGNILIGSLPGVWIGAHLSRRVPAAGLRPALGIVLLGSALGVMSKAGATSRRAVDRRRPARCSPSASVAVRRCSAADARASPTAMQRRPP